jgi:hypothetical protein
MIALLIAAAGAAIVTHTDIGDVYASEVPGSPYRSLEIHGKLNAPAWAVREVVLSPLQYALTPYLSEQRLVGSEQCEAGQAQLPGCKVHWLYTLVKPPWVAPRDFTIRVNLLHDDLKSGGQFELKWALSSDHGPASPPGAVRLRDDAGGWLIEAAGAVTNFVYRTFSDPGGNIPGWMANAGAEREVPKMIAAVEKAAAELAAKRAAAQNATVQAK